ncbi:hypothetical protein B0O80DRAFT_495851 [Mortierella sp. GBAus27b]|nr:hypothetical protein BGX31_005760 [Mortierella sp. GBA43]KAI8358071.1 hypothetical protein B0O80DRAFT_495851 [Mortierella sp. GBAus27b]
MSRPKATQKNASTAVSSGAETSSRSATRRNVASSSTNDQRNGTPKIQEIKDEDEDEDELDSDDEDESDASDSSDIDDIPDPEKWRIITESGILEQANARENRSMAHRNQEIEEADRDYLFEGIFFSIPTACLFIVMDILVHRQYGETYSGPDVISKLVKVFPAIFIMVYFSNKHKSSKFVQAIMFVVSTICGCYFLHTMYRSPALGIMLRAPGIITILVYCIVQLNLLPAVVSLALCGLYYQFGNVKYSH